MDTARRMRGALMRYLNEKQVAEMTGISLPTLRQDRSNRQRLPFVKFGKSVRYSEDDVRAFMEGHKIETAHLTDAEKAAFSRRLEHAKATLNALRSHGAAKRQEVYSLVKEAINLVETLVPGLAKKVPELEEMMRLLDEEAGQESKS